ncbi:GIY-YIG nuclease family protein [Brucella intermedia]|uniref:GIY-YIG nuclease family protein n=1 Tax=Brucella intermedia TaxID=94625 RepID=UPI00124BED30|nr:GIY-YIG nuclease family protein [Brucella intermedia]
MIEAEKDPLVAANRDVLHKIGVTGGDITCRLANAKLDATLLMADVEVIATYTLYNINRVKLENLIHRIFSPAQLDIEIKDRFGNPIVPREGFLVPRFVVDDAAERNKDGTITEYIYDLAAARLVRTGTWHERLGLLGGDQCQEKQSSAVGPRQRVGCFY